MRRVLVTGATGMVARGVLPLLAAQFDLCQFAPDVPEGRTDCIRGSLADRDALARALHGTDAVLHLAIASGHSGTYEDDAFNDLRFDVNVKGTYQVLDAALRAGVQRVVHVSSLMVTWGRALAWAAGKAAERVPGDAPPEPVGTYALTKALAEEVCRHYARRGLSVLVMRISAPFDPADLKPGEKVRPQQVPFTELAAAFCLALTVPCGGFEVVSVCGNSARCPWDLGAARRVLGYEPSLCLDDMEIELADPFAVAPS